MQRNSLLTSEALLDQLSRGVVVVGLGSIAALAPPGVERRAIAPAMPFAMRVRLSWYYLDPAAGALAAAVPITVTISGTTVAAGQTEVPAGAASGAVGEFNLDPVEFLQPNTALLCAAQGAAGNPAGSLIFLTATLTAA